MAGKPINPAGPTYHLPNRKAAVQRSVNAYIQKLDTAEYMMAATPGEVQVANLGAEVRGSRNVIGRWFVVAGTTLYEMINAGGSPPAWTPTARGTLLTGTGIVGMANNATQLAIVDGANLYIFNLQTNILTQITVPGWQGSDDVRELDGYFIFVDPGTEQFYLSAIDDGTQLDALDFSSADSSPDNIIAFRVSHRQLVLFGAGDSTEIWIDSGGAAFPFVRYNSYTLDVGCVGPRTVTNAADTLFWIGRTVRGTGIVYMLAGNQPQRVSTIAVETALQASTDLAGATMWAYQIEGHEFIGINAPGLETTWVYDAATQMWHERGEWSAGWQQLRSRFYTSVESEQYGGDSTGSIVRLDPDAHTLNGRPLVRERTWPHMVSPSLEPITYTGVELALSTGAGGDITLEISDDGGYAYGPPLLRSLGAAGRTMQRIRWLRLGASRNRVFRLRQSSPVPYALFAAAVDT